MSNEICLFLAVLLTLQWCCVALEKPGLMKDSNTVVGKPQLGLTVGISVGLFALFVGMAIFIYKPRKRLVRSSLNQPAPV